MKTKNHVKLTALSFQVTEEEKINTRLSSTSKCPWLWQRDSNGIIYARLLTMVVHTLKHHTWSN
jgi:hypothetical protein